MAVGFRMRLVAVGVWCLAAAALLLAPSTTLGAHPIEHVVVLMMENRSFDNLLGWLHETHPQVDGLTGKECNHVNTTDAKSEKVCVSKLGFDEGPDDPGHSLADTTIEIFGYKKPIDHVAAPLMNGFVADAHMKKHSLQMPMAMFTPSGSGSSSAPVINSLAKEFAVFDRWFASLPGPTDPNRGYAMSGSSVGKTTNYDGKLWQQQSYFDFLRRHNKTFSANYQDDPWAIWYFADLQKVPENRKCVGEMSKFFSDLKAGHIADFTWLQPRMLTHKAPPNWQHPDASVREGEKLIQEVYEALVAQPHIWNKTALIITYDEHGGFYDHVPPPQVGIPAPDSHVSPEGFKFDRLGVRIPTIVVSPWVPKGLVVHEPTGPTPTSHFEHTSTMSTVNKIFGIQAHMSARAAWAGTFESIFSLSEPRALDDVPHFPAMLESWTQEDLLRQGRKPLNDHLETQVDFYCLHNGHDLRTCNAAMFTNQRDASMFIADEVEKMWARLEREDAMAEATPVVPVAEVAQA